MVLTLPLFGVAPSVMDPVKDSSEPVILILGTIKVIPVFPGSVHGLADTGEDCGIVCPDSIEVLRSVDLPSLFVSFLSFSLTALATFLYPPLSQPLGFVDGDSAGG